MVRWLIDQAPTIFKGAEYQTSFEAHPAQVSAYEMLGLFLNAKDYPEKEVRERLAREWLSINIVKNDSLPKDRIYFRKDGELIPAITSLAIPTAYYS